MEFEMKQISSLEKIRTKDDLPSEEVKRVTLLQGESFSYQVCAFTENAVRANVLVESELSDCLHTYVVRDVPNDWMYFHDDDVITEEKCFIPDLLVPLEKQNGIVITENISPGTVWIKLDLPKDCKMGNYKIYVTYKSIVEAVCEDAQCILDITVLPCLIPEQNTLFTQWLHVDCIVNYHGVSAYSEECWSLIDKYMKLARECGINMILTPIITPPLDTAIGHRRTNVQLIRIEKNGDKYHFDFSLLDRWINMCHANGIEYFEIAHLFSQWGLVYSPNILVTVDGREEYLFGWHVESTDESYKDFLCQMLPALSSFLRKKGVFENCYFHISDEPKLEHMEMYRYAKSLVEPLIGTDGNFFDALSHIDFYDSGLLKIPVTATTDINPFLKKHIEHQWAYNCCGQYRKLGNRYIFMPSYRNRIMGVQLYKYNIEGFLHWGFNFYNSRQSLYSINPYVTTSSDRAFQSGNPFSVYPDANGALPSLRAFVFNEALQDIEICRLLERYIGKEKVIEMIDREAGMEVTFFEYPKNSQYVPNLMKKMKEILLQYI